MEGKLSKHFGGDFGGGISAPCDIIKAMEGHLTVIHHWIHGAHIFLRVLLYENFMLPVKAGEVSLASSGTWRKKQVSLIQ